MPWKTSILEIENEGYDNIKLDLKEINNYGGESKDLLSCLMASFGISASLEQRCLHVLRKIAAISGQLTSHVKLKLNNCWVHAMHYC